MYTRRPQRNKYRPPLHLHAHNMNASIWLGQKSRALLNVLPEVRPKHVAGAAKQGNDRWYLWQQKRHSNRTFVMNQNPSHVLPVVDQQG